MSTTNEGQTPPVPSAEGTPTSSLVLDPSIDQEKQKTKEMNVDEKKLKESVKKTSPPSVSTGLQPKKDSSPDIPSTKPYEESKPPHPSLDETKNQTMVIGESSLDDIEHGLSETSETKLARKIENIGTKSEKEGQDSQNMKATPDTEDPDSGLQKVDSKVKSSTDLPSSTLETFSDTKKRPRSPTVDAKHTEVEAMPKKIRDLKGASVLKTSQTSDENGMAQKPSTPSSKEAPLRADLLAAILGGSPSAPIGKHYDPSVEKKNQVPKTTTPDKEGDKKKRKKMLTVKVMKATRDIAIAKKTLAGKIELSKVLSVNECSFLAKEMWIFTTKQLKSVLTAERPNEMEAYNELFGALQTSNLLAPISSSTVQKPGERVDVQDDIQERGMSLQTIETKAGARDAAGFREAGDVNRESKRKEDDIGPRSIENVVPISILPSQKESFGHTGADTSESIDVTGTSPSIVDCEQTASPKDSQPLGADQNLIMSSNDILKVSNETTLTPGKDTKSKGESRPNEGKISIDTDSKESSNLKIKHPEATKSAGVTEETSKKVHEILKRWKEQLEMFEKDCMTDAPNPVEEQFHLDGAVKCLIPICTQRFLVSVNIYTVFDFLSHRRTESGMINDLYALWRRRCSLREVPRQIIARHLVSVGVRLISAIGSNCPPNKRERDWMGSHKIVLGGAAKPFLFDIDMHESERFVRGTTKTLANQLAEWRKLKGLPLLKGTGKVAMISAWKTQVREQQELTAEDGSILPKSWIKEMDETLFKQKKVKLASDLIEKAASYEAVGEQQSDDESSNLKLDTAHFESAHLQKEREGDHLKKSKSKTKMGLMIKFRQELSSETFLREIFDGDKIKLMNIIGIMNGQQLLDMGEQPDSQIIEFMMKSQKEYSGMGDEKQCLEILRQWRSSLVSHLDMINIKRKYSQQKKEIKDPFDALSDTSREFLSSLDIRDAKGFLSGKTSELSDALVKYRIDKHLPPLKGLGAVASISGWKSLVRNAAKNLGDEELVTLNAGRNAGIKLKPRKRKILSSNIVDDVQKMAKGTRPDMGGSKGSYLEIPKVTFWVGNDYDKFCFHLTNRCSSYDSSERSYYLTYRGHERIDNTPVINNETFSKKQFPILEHLVQGGEPANLSKKYFHTRESGLLELRNYGLFSWEADENMLPVIQKTLKAFIFQNNQEAINDLAKSVPYNVFQVCESGDTKYYFYVDKPMEKYQTVELRFLPYSPLNSKDETLRRWLVDSLASLQIRELRELLCYIHHEIQFGADEYIRKVSRSYGSPDSIARHDLKKMNALIIARRRIHWCALKIGIALRKKLDERTNLPAIAIKPLWTKAVIRYFSRHPDWENHLKSPLVTECKNEILSELTSDEFGHFYSSQEIWCPVAKTAFNEAILLMSELNAELDQETSELKLLTELGTIVTRSVRKVLKHALTPVATESNLSDLLLTVQPETQHSCSNFPTVDYLRSRLDQAYVDGMALANEIRIALPLTTEGRFVVISCDDEDAKTSDLQVDFRDVERFDPREENINVSWYVRTQIIAVVRSVVACGFMQLAFESATLTKKQHLQSIISDSAKAAMGGQEISDITLKGCPTVKLQTVPATIINSAQLACNIPASQPIFLCIVWPVLRKLKWRLEAESESSSVVFFAPRQKVDASRRLEKQKSSMSAQDRTRVAYKTTKLGLGCLPKEVKRMFVACAPSEKMDITSESTVSVATSLNAFRDSLVESSPDFTFHSKVSQIVESIGSLFECIASLLIDKDDTTTIGPADGASWKDTLGNEYLLRFLLVLPKLLNQSDLSRGEQEFSRGVILELIDFLVQKRDILFASSHQLPFEKYDKDYEIKKSVIDYLSLAKNQISSDALNTATVTDDFSDVVLPEDRLVLTDFVSMVMDQLMFCRARLEDLNMKGRRAHTTLGRAGLVCRHCIGKGGDGKYFYSNPASLATASTSVDKHLFKCPMVGAELKNRLQKAKSLHLVQRSSLPIGSQSAFFSRLWHRLQSSTSSTDSAQADIYVTLQSEVSPTTEENGYQSLESISADDCEGFRNHIDIVHHIENKEPWASNQDVLNALEKYYYCLRWGAANYCVSTSDSLYNSEKVLGRLGFEVHDHYAQNTKMS